MTSAFCQPPGPARLQIIFMAASTTFDRSQGTVEIDTTGWLLRSSTVFKYGKGRHRQRLPGSPLAFTLRAELLQLAVDGVDQSSSVQADHFSRNGLLSTHRLNYNV